ncbi:flagellar basal-body rod protein FlgF [Gluconacetobacter liquefaciens]|uniref:Flagellar basal-body rod protein FlgF n=1 Tax=Gluconacetobacter liquefaciens TaxID=89584 RepID=A0A370GAL9_GLULI|nr:flagellar basal-body rod protein FlgF [Gluconacetobacter liquefaciens]MBB2185718.1 flagellar basal-body rod protein FlgF [Gluconacetobacter liquefaciens]RDI39524.1 flagellar basal-body rod protein FlgF [Gluconacetobacter liquefaciens]GBQ95060.1 flagellar basal body rod protein FlgF [Gluconacetobacter liquefaciens NRIC 0522]GEB36164.1 flagellar basal-body rod protein FlgF [Gluconacetobacter liquefaciens]
MDNTTYIALSRLDTLTRALDVTANNLANANTDGFKASRQLFSEYLVKQKGPNTLPGDKQESYTQDQATYRDQLQGPLKSTGNLTDFAINGEGYFTVRTTQGIRLTRNGQFHRRMDGTIVDGSGNPVLDNAGRNLVLQNEEDLLSVATDGSISTQTGVIGTIGLVTVDNPQTLMPEGHFLLRPTTQTHTVARPEIRQAMLESSNVNAVSEATRMVEIQRDYDLTFQLIQTESTRNMNAIDKITAEPSA